MRLLWARIKTWLGLKPLAARHFDVVGVTNLERQQARECNCYFGHSSDGSCKACSGVPVTHCPRRPVLSSAFIDKKFLQSQIQFQRHAAGNELFATYEMAIQAEKMIAYGLAIGLSKEQVESAIKLERQAARVTINQFSWDRVRRHLIRMANEL